MPLPNNAYFPLFPIQEQIINSTDGTPLASGSVSFFQDQDRTVPKSVYQRTENPDNTFTYQDLGSVLQLSSIGTFTDPVGNNIIPFMWPYEGLPTDSPPSTAVQLYYIIVADVGGVPQFTVSAWPPEVSGGSEPPPGGNDIISSTNIISNPQFAVVNFNSPTTFSVSAPSTIEIAPDWSIVTTGTGTITVSQIALTDTLAPGVPAFALSITSASISTLVLSQNIFMSPRILENGYASGTFIVQSLNSSSPEIAMFFNPSDPALTSIPIVSGNALQGGFTEYSATVNLDAYPTNPDNGSVGYVNVQMSIPVGASIYLSAIQLISVPDAITVPEYIQESTPRQIDHLFHYYQPKLNFKPIPSYLVGWDFATNPTQFGSSIGAQALGANTSYYAWDQTIIYQLVTSGVSIARSRAYMQVTAAATTQLAVIQYLSGAQALEIFYQAAENGLSVGIEVGAPNGTPTSMTISLWWTASALPAIGSNISLVSSLDAYGHPSSVVAGWNEIKWPYGSATFTPISSIQFFGFSGFRNLSAYTSGANFAIVVGTSSVTSGNVINFQSISCVPGNIPTRPAPQTADEVLRECQYYYEVSDPDTNPVYFPMNAISLTGSNVAASFASPFQLNYQQKKRAAPTVTINSGTPTAANVSSVLFYANTGGTFTATTAADIALGDYWNATVGTTRAAYVPKKVTYIGQTNASSSTVFYSSAEIYFTYTLDSRLGVV